MTVEELQAKLASLPKGAKIVLTEKNELKVEIWTEGFGYVYIFLHDFSKDKFDRITTEDQQKPFTDTRRKTVHEDRNPGCVLYHSTREYDSLKNKGYTLYTFPDGEKIRYYGSEDLTTDQVFYLRNDYGKLKAEKQEESDYIGLAKRVKALETWAEAQPVWNRFNSVNRHG